MANKSQKLSHAQHNEEVFEYLSPKTSYVDWICITAFYSAIHYVDHKIFPFNDTDSAGQKFKVKCIDNYRNIYRVNTNKHKTREKLVEERLILAKAHFSFLRHLGHSARYINYTFNKPNDVIKQVRESLSQIKEICITK